MRNWNFWQKVLWGENSPSMCLRSFPMDFCPSWNCALQALHHSLCLCKLTNWKSYLSLYSLREGFPRNLCFLTRTTQSLQGDSNCCQVQLLASLLSVGSALTVSKSMLWYHVKIPYPQGTLTTTNPNLLHLLNFNYIHQVIPLNTEANYFCSLH